MATTVGTLVVNVIGDASQLSSSLGAAEKTIERFGSRMFFLGSRITAGVTLPIAGFITAINKIGSEFDSAMTESLAIMDNVSAEMRKKLEQRAFDIARTSKFSAAEIAKGYYDLASAGFTAEGALENIGTVATFAQAGLMKMDEAGEYLSGAVKALGHDLVGASTEAEAMARVADVLTAANNSALGTVEDFSRALTTRFASGMKSVNMSVEEGVGFLMAFAQQNIKGKEASQQAWMALRDVQSATIRASGAWKQYGVSVYDAAGQMRSMPDILDQIQMRMKGFTKSQVQEWLRTGVRPEAPAGKAMSAMERRTMLLDLKLPDRSVTALQKVLGESGPIREFTEELKNSVGEAARVAEEQGKAMAVRWENAWNAVENAGVKFYNSFKPILIEVFDLVGKAGDKLATMAEKFDTLSDGTKKWVAGLVIGVAALGPLLALSGSWILLMSGFLHTMGGAAKIIGGFTALLKPLVGMMGATSAATVTATGLWANLVVAGQTLMRMLPNLAKLFGPLVLIFDALRPAISYIIEKFGGLQGIWNSITTTIGNSDSTWKQWWATIKNVHTILSTFWTIVQFGWVQLVRLAELIGSDLVQAWGSLNRFVEWGKGKLVEYWNTFIGFGSYLVGLIRDIPVLGPILGGIWEVGAKVLMWYWDLVKQFFSYIGDKLGWLGSIGGKISGALRSVLPKEYVDLVDTIADVAKNADGFHDGMRRMANGMQLYAHGIGAVDLKANNLGKTFDRLKPVLTRTGVAIDPNAMDISGLTPPGEGGFPPERPTSTKRDPVKEALDELMGEGARKWQHTWEAFDKNRKKILENEEAVARLGEAYMSMRDKIDLIPELEKLFETKIAVQNMENLRASIGGLLDDLGPAENALAKNQLFLHNFAMEQKRLIDTAGVGATVFSPDFFRKHGKDIEDLAKNYKGLSPGIQLMIGEYQRWKKTVEAADDAVRYHKLNIEGLTTIYDGHGDMMAKLKDKSEELTNFRLSESTRGLKGIQKNLEQEKLAFNKQWVNMAEALRKLTGPALDEGIKKFLEFQAAGKEYFETAERLSLEQLALQLGVDARLLSSFRHMTAEKIRGILEVVAAANKEKAVWDSLASSFATLADAFGVGDNNILRWFATLSSAMGEATKAGADLAASGAAIKAAWGAEGGADWGAIASAAVSGMDAIARGAAAINKATSSASKGRNIVGGAMTGAKIGMNPALMAASGGTSVIIGAVIGGIVGAVRGRTLRDIMRNAAKDWGTDISQELAKSIEKTMKDKGIGRQQASLLHFQDILGEAGGLSDKNFGQFSARLKDFFVMAETGAMSAGTAMSEYSKNFGTMAEFVTAEGRDLSRTFQGHIQTMTDQLRRGVISNRDVRNFFDTNFQHFVDNMDKLGGVASSAWKDVINLSKEMDKLPKQMEEFLTAATGAAAKSWVTMIASTTKEFKGLANEIKKAKESGEGLEGLLARQNSLAADFKDEMARVGNIVLATFNASLESGLGFSTVMAQMAPAIDAMVEGYADLGIEIDNVALKELVRYRELMKNNEALFAGIDAMSEGMIALSKIGGLTASSFADITAQSVVMFRRMQGAVAAAGGTHADALRPFLGFLAEARHAAEEYGFVLDATTQEMIDQAVELGMLKPKALSVTDAMAAGFDRVADRLERIGQLLAQSLGVIWDMGDAAGSIVFPEGPAYSYPGIPTPYPNGGSTPSNSPGGVNPYYQDPSTTNVNFNLTTTQPVDEQFVQTTIIPSIVRAVETNQRGARTDLGNALGV